MLNIIGTGQRSPISTDKCNHMEARIRNGEIEARAAASYLKQMTGLDYLTCDYWAKWIISKKAPLKTGEFY